MAKTSTAPPKSGKKTEWQFPLIVRLLWMKIFSEKSTYISMLTYTSICFWRIFKNFCKNCCKYKGQFWTFLPIKCKNIKSNLISFSKEMKCSFTWNLDNKIRAKANSLEKLWSVCVWVEKKNIWIIVWCTESTNSFIALCVLPWWSFKWDTTSWIQEKY